MFAIIYCHVNIAEIYHCLYIKIITNKESKVNAKAISLWQYSYSRSFNDIKTIATTNIYTAYYIISLICKDY